MAFTTKIQSDWLHAIRQRLYRQELKVERQSSVDNKSLHRIVVHGDVMAASVDTNTLPNYDQQPTDGSEKVKIICLGDSAVGKSKWAPIFFFVFDSCS